MTDWKTSLVQYFKNGIKADSAHNLGVEVEHFIVTSETGASVPYEGAGGVRDILGKLLAHYPEAELLHDDDFFGFTVPDFAITLEPAAQLEISMVTTASIERIGEIYRGFFDHLSQVLKPLGYRALQVGGRPCDEVASLKLIPKKRYDLMNAHFQKTGTGGMEMMRGTSSLQVSIDYRSEEDFRNKIQAAYYYGPLLKLFCDHTRVFQGEPVKIHLKRTDIWRRVDPARCGILPGIFSPDYGFENYAAFIGKMPPIFLKRGMEVTPTGFRTVEELFGDEAVDEAMTAHLLSMAFPDVRLKQFIEIRFADAVPYPFMLAYCALIKGLLYSEEGLQYAQKQISGGGLSEKDILRSEDNLMKDGWQGLVYGVPAADMAAQMLGMAERNLEDDEKHFLEPFYKVLQYGGIYEIPEKEYEEKYR